MPEYTFPDEKASSFPIVKLPSTENNVLSWRNLTLDTWFHITNEKNVEMKDGELVKILTLAQEGGATCNGQHRLLLLKLIEKERNRTFLHLYTSSLWEKTIQY